MYNTFKEFHQEFCTKMIGNLNHERNDIWFKPQYGLCANWYHFLAQDKNTGEYSGGRLQDFFDEIYPDTESAIPFNEIWTEYLNEKYEGRLYQNEKRMHHLRTYCNASAYT